MTSEELLSELESLPVDQQAKVLQFLAGYFEEDENFINILAISIDRIKKK